VATHGLKAQHDLGQSLGRAFLAMTFPADVPILTVNAAQVAPGEEHGARAGPTPDAVLFAVMWSKRMDDGARTGVTDSAAGAFQAVHAAVSGAKITRAHVPLSQADASIQFTVAHERNVRWHKGVASGLRSRHVITPNAIHLTKP
jgi:hypothetical protein